MQKEHDRLLEVQTKILNESRKREQELRKQVKKSFLIFSRANPLFQHQTELEKMENEYLQRTNDNHLMLKNVTLQNETLSSTFKVEIFLLISFRISMFLFRNKLKVFKPIMNDQYPSFKINYKCPNRKLNSLRRV